MQHQSIVLAVGFIRVATQLLRECGQRDLVNVVMALGTSHPFIYEIDSDVMKHFSTHVSKKPP